MLCYDNGITLAELIARNRRTTKHMSKGKPKMNVKCIVCAALIFSLSLGGCAPMHSTSYSESNYSSSSQEKDSFLGKFLLGTAAVIGLVGLIAVLDDGSDNHNRHDKQRGHSRQRR
jgi:hypothetical protein